MNSGQDWGRGFEAIVVLAAVGMLGLLVGAGYGVAYVACHLAWVP